MDKLMIRRANEGDVPGIGKLLDQVHRVHSDIRPDLFKGGSRKYTDSQLREILADSQRPVFVAVQEQAVLGHAFCVHQQRLGDPSMTDVKTLYIDDLCVDAAARGGHIGRTLYEYILAYAKERGYYNVALNVWVGNDSAMKFYEALGLRPQKIGMEQIL